MGLVKLRVDPRDFISMGLFWSICASQVPCPSRQKSTGQTDVFLVNFLHVRKVQSLYRILSSKEKKGVGNTSDGWILLRCKTRPLKVAANLYHHIETFNYPLFSSRKKKKSILGRLQQVVLSYDHLMILMEFSEIVVTIRSAHQMIRLVIY